MSTTRREAGADAPENLLSRHHDALQRRFASLVAKAEGGDPVQLRAEWGAFEDELLRHLELEEAELLPELERELPAEAEAIRREHAEIRQALIELGVKLDLHLLRAETVQDFVARLAEHARREEQVLYPWAGRHVSRGRWVTLGRALRTAGRRAGDRLLKELGHVM